MNEQIVWIYRGTSTTPPSKFRKEIDHIALGAIQVHQRCNIETDSTRSLEIIHEGGFSPEKKRPNKPRRKRIVRECFYSVVQERFAVEIEIQYCWESYRDENGKYVDTKPFYEVYITQLEFPDYDDDDVTVFQQEEDEDEDD